MKYEEKIIRTKLTFRVQRSKKKKQKRKKKK